MGAGERAQRKCTEIAADGKERWEAQTFLFFLYRREEESRINPSPPEWDVRPMNNVGCPLHPAFIHLV